MHSALRAGAAIYNAGHYHAAHDAWEDVWLDLDSDTPDERLLHGLIQFTAVVHHAQAGNFSGARGLAASAGEYLAALPADARGVNLPDVRRFLAQVAADPEALERRQPPVLRIDGQAPALRDLDFPAGAIAAEVLAAERPDYDADVVAQAATYAREEQAAGPRTRFTTLVLDFAGDAENRPVVYRRLADLVDRRQRREGDVDGLFE